MKFGIIIFLSLIVFSWIYSTVFNCLLNLNKHTIISLLIYLIIAVIVYILSYNFLFEYFKTIIVCSVIAGLLSMFTAKKGAK